MIIDIFKTFRLNTKYFLTVGIIIVVLLRLYLQSSDERNRSHCSNSTRRSECSKHRDNSSEI